MLITPTIKLYPEKAKSIRCVPVKYFWHLTFHFLAINVFLKKSSNDNVVSGTQYKHQKARTHEKCMSCDCFLINNMGSDWQFCPLIGRDCQMTSPSESRIDWLVCQKIRIFGPVFGELVMD